MNRGSNFLSIKTDSQFYFNLFLFPGRQMLKSSTNYSTLLTFYDHHFNFLSFLYLFLVYVIFEELYACMPFWIFLLSVSYSSMHTLAVILIFTDDSWAWYIHRNLMKIKISILKWFGSDWKSLELERIFNDFVVCLEVV